MSAPENPRFVWISGRLVPWENATVHVSDLGFADTAAVFDTSKAYVNPKTGDLNVFRVKDHVKRFFQSMKIVRMDPPASLAEVEAAALDLLGVNEVDRDTTLWFIAYHGGGWRKALSKPEDQPTELLINLMPFQSRLTSGKGESVCISTWRRITDASNPPRLKAFANYHSGRLANMQARVDGYDEAILLTESGKVAEAPGACLFLVRDGVLITPSVTSSVLESVTRSTLLQVVPECLGVQAIEREVDRTELYVADEVFLCGTGAEITPVFSVDRFPVGSGEMGPITASIDRLYHDMVRGLDPRHPEWQTKVAVGAKV